MIETRRKTVAKSSRRKTRAAAGRRKNPLAEKNAELIAKKYLLLKKKKNGLLKISKYAVTKKAGRHYVSFASFRNSKVVGLDLSATLDAYDFIPQAIIKRDVSSIAKRIGMSVSKGNDDFDSYEGVALYYRGLICTVMHYRGHPDKTCSIYLPREFKDVPDITRTLAVLQDGLALKDSEFSWQRKDDPDL